jgi:hypothetical protein
MRQAPQEIHLAEEEGITRRKESKVKQKSRLPGSSVFIELIYENIYPKILILGYLIGETPRFT